MKLLIWWWSDAPIREQKFLGFEVIEKSFQPNTFLVSWMTKGAIHKHLTMRKVSEEAWAESLRNAAEKSRLQT